MFSMGFHWGMGAIGKRLKSASEIPFFNIYLPADFVHAGRVRAILQELVADGVIVKIGDNRYARCKSLSFPCRYPPIHVFFSDLRRALSM
jgi:hypothetical protein